jgi:hypothetical protein
MRLYAICVGNPQKYFPYFETSIGPARGEPQADWLLDLETQVTTWIGTAQAYKISVGIMQIPDLTAVGLYPKEK